MKDEYKEVQTKRNNLSKLIKLKNKLMKKETITNLQSYTLTIKELE